jgi:hypothetical protein
MTKFRMKNFGTYNVGMILGIWLIAMGLRGVINLSFQSDHLIFGLIAIAAGILIILRR